MKFNIYFEDRKPVFSDPGSPIKDECQVRVVDGVLELVKTGETNLYDYIQSHKDSVDIHKILERCALLDDYSILNRMPSAFMDVTEMPTSLAEAYSAIKDAENFFERMPVDIKQSYDNSFTDFLQSLGSEKFNKVVGSYLDSIKVKDNAAAAAQEVTNGES